MKTNIHLWSYLAHFFVEWEMLQIKFLKVKTHIFCSVTCFLIVRFMRYCSKILHSRAGYKHTLRFCNTNCFSTVTMVAQTHLSVTLYVHCLSCSLYVLVYHELHVFCFFSLYNVQSGIVLSWQDIYLILVTLLKLFRNEGYSRMGKMIASPLSLLS